MLEPDKFGDIAWIDPNSPPPGLFPATAALLKCLGDGHAEPDAVAKDCTKDQSLPM